MQKKGLLTKIVVVLVLIAFLTVGISSYEFDDKKVLAKVGKSKIYLDDFESTYKREIAHIRNSWGSYIDESQLEAFGLSDIVLRDMINNKVVDNIIQKINLDINDDTVITFIKDHEMFQKEDHTFDREKFLLFLQNNQILEKDYIKKVKEDFLRTIFFKIFALKHVDYHKIAGRIYENSLEKRAVEIVKVPYDKVDITQKPTTKELEQYYDTHKNKFIRPEQRSINLFLIDETHLTTDEVSKKEAETEFYSMDLDKKFTLKYAFFQNKKDTEDHISSTSANVESLWQSLGNDKIIALNNVFRADIPFEIQNVLSELEVNKMSPIIETEAGCYIVLLEKVQQISDAEKEENYKIIQSSIKERKKSEKLDALMLQIKSELDSGKSLEEIAKSGHMLKLKKFIKLNKNDTSKLEEQIIKQIFNAQINQLADFTEDKQGNYYAFEVIEITPEHIQDFSEARDLVEKHWKAEKKFETANLILMKSIKDNVDEIKIIKEKKIFSNPAVTQTTESDQLGDDSQGYKSEFIDRIFNLRNIGDITSPIEEHSSVMLAILKEKILPINIDVKDEEENIKKVNKAIKDVLHNSLLEEFIHYYSKIFKVEINNKYK